MMDFLDRDELDRQITAQDTKVVALQAELGEARKTLAALTSIRSAARQLAGEVAEDRTVTSAASLLPSSRTMLDNISEALTATATRINPTGVALGRKKTPSTRNVAMVVAAARRPVTREEIYDDYQKLYGFPPSWNNPANALNNAIGRAIEKDWVEVNDDGQFVTPENTDMHEVQFLKED